MRYVNRARDTLEDMLHFDEQLSESPIIGQHGNRGITLQTFQTEHT